ncbi:GNAT family N-acetyltransferase [Streptomyces sp. NPDC007088]|uniref:GNAT family N-acetyltransferase n=1 Tax=Streptomyces sp. NPDC007088 TaxID=3364773 RepID=UPI00368A8D39
MPIRPATAEDAPFLTDMLREAFDWTGQGRFTREQVRTDPAIAHHVEGWPLPGDFGVVAVEEGEAGEEPAGAAWARALPAEDPGCGFVAPDVPEIMLAVAPGHRGRGLARALLTALVDEAARRGVARLSLSVEDGNGVARLYREAGFTAVGRSGEADTMVLDVGRRTGGGAGAGG